GGSVRSLNCEQSLLAISRDLRQHAANHADVVVLHTNPEDVIAPVAFGVSAGPPVLFVNHADHLFWLGVSVADLVVDIRDAGHRWTREHRGVREARIVPIPLTNPDLVRTSRAQLKREARKALSLPDDRVILLTIGDGYKYVPSGGLNFLSAAQSILSSRSDV